MYFRHWWLRTDTISENLAQLYPHPKPPQPWPEELLRAIAHAVDRIPYVRTDAVLSERIRADCNLPDGDVARRDLSETKTHAEGQLANKAIIRF